MTNNEILIAARSIAYPPTKKTNREIILIRLRNAQHNVIAHPLAGLCWLVGAEKAGDWIHSNL